MKSLKDSANKALAVACFAAGVALMAQPVLAARCLANTPATVVVPSGCGGMLTGDTCWG